MIISRQMKKGLSAAKSSSAKTIIKSCQFENDWCTHETIHHPSFDYCEISSDIYAPPPLSLSCQIKQIHVS